jgi:hypothetical protein
MISFSPYFRLHRIKTKTKMQDNYIKKLLPAVTDPPGEFIYMTISCSTYSENQHVAEWLYNKF